MSAILYAVAGLLALGAYAWLTRPRRVPVEPADDGFFYHPPDAGLYVATLAERTQRRTEQQRRADAVWAMHAGPDSRPGVLTSPRLPSRAEVLAWLGYTPSWQRETVSTGVLPPPGGTRLVTRYQASVERYRHGAGSLGELLAEMDLLTAQHIRAVAGPLVLPAATVPPALAEGVRA